MKIHVRHLWLFGGALSIDTPSNAKMIGMKLWDAAANDTVGGRSQHKGPKGVSQALMQRYDGMGKQERKSRLAAIK